MAEKVVHIPMRVDVPEWYRHRHIFVVPELGYRHELMAKPPREIEVRMFWEKECLGLVEPFNRACLDWIEDSCSVIRAQLEIIWELGLGPEEENWK